ncbi:MAG: hypothetical protein WBE72_25705 [Terracidiphilus sp.]
MPLGFRSLLAFAVFALVIAGSGLRAQSVNPGSAEFVSESGLHRAVFKVPQGTIWVNFPDDMAAGDAIFGSVYTEPSGIDQKERDRNSGELAHYLIAMDGTATGASAHRFGLRIPARAPSGSSTVELRDRKNKSILKCQLPVDPPAPANSRADFALPSGAQAGAFVSAWVPAGDPGASVTVGGETAAVLAESPRKVVFLSPPDVVGESTLVVSKDGASAATAYSSLRLQRSAIGRHLLRGETADLTVRVSGLQNLKAPAWLVILNHAPQTVELSGGAEQQIAIQQADVRPDGTFQVTRRLTGVESGDFEIGMAATVSPSSDIPLRGIVDRTIDSWSQLSAVSVSPDARDLIVTGVAEAQQQLDGFLRVQLAFNVDPGSLLDWLVRDYCFDLLDRKLQPAALGESSRRLRAPFGHAFLSPGTAPNSLDASAVRGFSFLRYLAGLLSRVSTSQPVGDLLVASEPDQQMITIDAFSGEGYFTNRSFVVSAGSHTVAVASCRKDVIVTANEKAKVTCPDR